MSLDRFEPGDRVEYPIYDRPSPYSLREIEIEATQGTVIDVVRGEAGELQIVASRPADTGGRVNSQSEFRIDFHLTADLRPTVRLVR